MASCSLALALTLLLSGCRTTRTVVGTSTRTAHFLVTSEPAGAEVKVNGRPMGRTPAKISLSYQEIQEEVQYGDRKNAKWALVSGLASLVGGGILLGVGLGTGDWGNPYASNTGPLTASILGGTVLFYALIGTIYGGVALSVSRPPELITVTDPGVLDVQLKLPDGERPTARIESRVPNFYQTEIFRLERLHYSDRLGNWRAPGLSDKIRIVPGSIPRPPPPLPPP